MVVKGKPGAFQPEVRQLLIPVANGIQPALGEGSSVVDSGAVAQLSRPGVKAAQNAGLREGVDGAPP